MNQIELQKKDKATDLDTHKATDDHRHTTTSDRYFLADKMPPITKSESDWLRHHSHSQSIDPALGFGRAPVIESEGKHAKSNGLKDKPDCSRPSGLHPKKLKKDWVVSLDLTVHLGTDTAIAQRERLESLAKSTGGRSVAYVVQDVEPTGKGNEQELHRYIIADGDIKELPTEASKGFAADAGSLVSKANELVDAKKKAFIEMGHGLGNGGFGGNGDQNPASVKSVADALKAGNGGKPLNDLVFDSCLTAQDGAIKALASAARDGIVATAEVGGGDDPNVRGLNYEKTLEKLAANPAMDGKSFAKQFVQDARDGANMYQSSTGKMEAGIQGLTAFDPSKVKAFDAALGKFGDTLKHLETSPGNREILQRLIEQTFRYDIVYKDDQKRDISAFAQAVRNSIAQGELKDRDHRADDAAKELLRAQKDMTEGTYGRKGTPYDGLGGLSVFLPSSDHIAKQSGTPMGLADTMDSVVQKALAGADPSRTLGMTLHNMVSKLQKTMVDHPEFKARIEELQRLASQVEQGNQLGQQALRKFQSSFRAMRSDPAFRSVLMHELPLDAEDDLSVSGNAGWTRFVRSMY